MSSVLQTIDFPRQLNAARLGSRSAQDMLFTRYYPRVERIAHAQLRNARGGRGSQMASRFSTADIVQEVFQNLLRTLPAFKGNTEGEFMAYVTSIIRCRILDVVRFHGASRRDYRRSLTPPNTDSCERLARVPSAQVHAVEQADVKELIARAIGTLPTAAQDILRARIEQSMPFDPIAKKLGYPSRYAARRAFFAAQAQLAMRLQVTRTNSHVSI